MKLTTNCLVQELSNLLYTVIVRLSDWLRGSTLHCVNNLLALMPLANSAPLIDIPESIVSGVKKHSMIEK